MTEKGGDYKLNQTVVPDKSKMKSVSAGFKRLHSSQAATGKEATGIYINTVAPNRFSLSRAFHDILRELSFVHSTVL